MELRRMTHMWRVSRRAAAMLALVIAVAAAPMALAAPSAQLDSTLIIGYLGPADSATASGAQLAIDQINGAGGLTGPDGTVYSLELATLGMDPTRETLASDLELLLEQDVVAVLGPDESDVLTADNIAALAGAGVPVLTGATSNSLTDGDEGNTLLRIRAPERVYSTALANYLTTDLGLTSIALVQTNLQSTEAAALFESVLTLAEIDVVGKFQLPNGDNLAAPAEQLLEINPEAVVMWGAYADATALLGLLRDGGWEGRFAYRYADEAAQAGVLSDELGEGVIGVTSWSYAYTGRAARIFLQDYLVTYGVIPAPLSVAAYDAIWYLRGAIISQGPDAEGLAAAMAGGAAISLVGGSLRPADFGNGDLIRVVMVYEIGAHGGATVLALFDDTQRLTIEDAGPQVVPPPEPPDALSSLPAVPEFAPPATEPAVFDFPPPEDTADDSGGVSMADIEQNLTPGVVDRIKLVMAELGVFPQRFALNAELSGANALEDIVASVQGTAVSGVADAMANNGLVGQVVYVWDTGATCADPSYYALQADFNLFASAEGAQTFLTDTLYRETMQSVGMTFEDTATGVLAATDTTHACGPATRYIKLATSGRFVIMTQVVVIQGANRDDVLAPLNTFSQQMIDESRLVIF